MPVLKLFKRAFVLVFLLLITACSHGSNPALHDTHGHLVQLSKLRGKWVIVNYWADWCDGCVKEVSELNRFYHDTGSNKGNKNIVIMSVDYDRLPPKSLNDAITKTGIEYPVLIEDPDSAWQLGEINVLPVTFIIDPKGRLVKTILGPNTEKSLQDTILSLEKMEK